MLLAVITLALLAAAIGLGRKALRSAGERHSAQLFILSAPGACLALGILLVATCFAWALTCLDLVVTCFVSPSLLLASRVMLFALTIFAISASFFALGRLLLLGWLLRRRSFPASQELQQMVATLAARMKVAPPTVRVQAVDRPLAFIGGIAQPALILSPWVLCHLDQREREAVIAHELAHVARGDQRVLALATWLRDAFWYVPTSRLAWRQLRQEQEFACDDRAVRLTGRPLALASALAKVWHAGVALPAQGYVPALLDDQAALEVRIARLTALPGGGDQPPAAVHADTAPLLAASTRYTAILLTLASCGFVALLWRLL